MLNIHHIEKNNSVNGNGERYVIWLQGCTLHCKGCWNRQTWDTEINEQMSVLEIYEDIVKQNGIFGITMSGGEPLLQATELNKLVDLIHENTDLSVHLFTGFELEEIDDPNMKELISKSDVIVSGRFDMTKFNNNQKVKYNSDSEKWDFNNSDVEVEIDEEANVLLTGYPTDDLIASLR